MPATKSGNPKKAAAARKAKEIPFATKDHLSKKKPATSTLRIILDEDLAVELEEAQDRLEKAIRLGATAEVLHERRKAFEEAEKRASEGEAAALLKLKAIGRRRWKELEDEHPPTPEQDAEFRAATKDPDDPNSKGDPAAFNPETFGPAVISETVVEPKMSPEEWIEFTDDWSENEYMILWMAVCGVNQRTRIQHWGKG